MGNKCSKKTSNTVDENQEISDYDLTVYSLRREKVFYGTIAICIVYASFALLLFILSLLSPQIKFLLLNNFLPFTIIYILGTIGIVLYLIAQVVRFKPYKIDKNLKYNNMSCPDYWTLNRLKNYDQSAANITTMNEKFKKAFDTTTANENLYEYRCELNEKLFDRFHIYRGNASGTGVTSGSTLMKTKYYFTDISGTAGNQSKNYFEFTNSALANKVKNDTRTANDKNINLYVNLYDYDSSNAVKRNIFKNDSGLFYEYVKNVLLMNNYKIVTNPADLSDKWTVFQRTVPLDITGNSEYDQIKTRIPNLHFHDFDTNQGDDTSNLIGNKAIAVRKRDGQMWLELLNTVTGGSYNASTNAISAAPKFNTPADDAKDDASIANDMATHFPLICDSVYPQLLAANDELNSSKNSKFDNNIFRCAYSKMCGIPWSDMNCDKYEDKNPIPRKDGSGNLYVANP